MHEFAKWVRTVGDRATFPSIALTLVICSVARPGWLHGFWLWVAAGLVLALVMTIPLAAILAYVPGESSVERRAREVRQARNRASLAKAGLAAEQYVASIATSDILGRAMAAEKFGVAITRQSGQPEAIGRTREA